MAEGDFSVYAKIQADTSNFEKGMKRAQTSATNLSNTFGNLSKTISKALSFAGLVVGTKAVVDFGKSCVKSATEATKQFNLLNNTIKATGADAWTTTKEMDNLAKSLSDSTNYSVTEIEKMQSVLLGFRDITGDTFEEASNAVLDMATVMGMDLTSAVQTVGKALDDPIKGLDSLRRQGFAFTDEQKAELAQLVKTGKKMEAQKIILDELARTYGGASKAGQDSFAKQRHAVENFSDALGGKLLPLMKSFAIDNANMINSLRDSLEKIDFNQIGAVVKVTFDGIKKGIQSGFEPIKNLSSEIKNFTKGIDFKPILSIVDSLAGAFERIGKIKLTQSMGALGDLKSAFSGFAENIDLTKFSEVVNLIISGFVFLYEEVNKVLDTLVDNIKTFVVNIWNSIKSLFEAGNKALADSETDIKSWGDYFYKIFNNLFRTVQDVIQSISYLLSGDWEIAWQYAKLVVLRIVDSVIDSMTTMVTAFKDKIISVLKFAEVLSPFLGSTGKMIKTALEGIELLVSGVDKHSKEINDTMDKMVSDTETKIEELTGKPVDKNIKDLDRLESGSKNALDKFVDNFKEATAQVKKELDNLSGEYNASLGGEGSKDKNDKEFKLYSEWDSKLLQQRLEHLNEYSNEYHKVQLELIELERQKALQADSTGAEAEKINEYYNKKIEEENERFEEAKRKQAWETVKKISGYLKELASKAIETFKKVSSTIKNVFSTIGNFIKNTFSKIKNTFSKLFEFNVDDALDSLLKIEDSILTFFVETLPRLPSFFESAFSSVSILVKTLMDSIDWNQVKGFLTTVVDVFVKEAPGIVEGIMNIFTNIVTVISDVFVEKAPEIVEAVGSMFFAVIEALPAIIEKVISALGSAISAIGKYISENAERLSNDLTAIIKSLIDGISNFVKNGGWKNILEAFLAIQKAIEDALVENMDEICETIASMLPALIEVLKKSIVSASKTLGKLAPKIIPLIADLINAIVEVITSDEVLESSYDAVEGIVEGLVKAIIKLLPNAVTKLIIFSKKLTDVATISKLVVHIVEGLVEAFIHTDWIQVIKDCFFGFIDAIKEFFGIHSPSTLFKEFGEFMIEGLWEGIKNFGKWLWDNVKKFFENFVKNFKKIFEGIGNWFKDIFSKAWKNIEKAFSGAKKWAEGVGKNIKNAFEGVGDWFKKTFEGAWENIKNAFEGVGDWASGVWGKIKEGFTNVADWFKDIFSKAWEGIKSAFSTAKNWASSVWSGIKEGFSNVGEWFKNTFEGAWNGIKNAFSGVGDWFKNTFSGAWDGIQSAFSGARSFFGSLFSNIGSSISSFVSSAWSSISNVASYIGSSIGSALGNVWSSVSSTVSSIGSQLYNGVQSAISSVRSALSSFGSSVRRFFGWANGTNDAPRGLALVGEQGPELVRFNGGEQVINNHNTQKLLAQSGKDGNTFNVTFNNLQDTTAYTMLQQLKQYNRQMAINGVL